MNFYKYIQLLMEVAPAKDFSIKRKTD